MTAKEAISQLQERIDLINKDYFDLQLDKYAEALEMAIEALSHLADPGKKVSSSCGQENDPVSRKAAIDAIEDYLDEYSGLDEEGYHGEKWCAMAEAKMVIENLPSAQPERKKGRWIKVNGKTAINCSACYHCSWSRSFEDTVKRFNFCPNCGADMRGEEE